MNGRRATTVKIGRLSRVLPGATIVAILHIAGSPPVLVR
jgi:hypothetical protein